MTPTMLRSARATGVVLGLVIAAGLLLAGCDRKSSWPEPAEQLPAWVYDAPYYFKPQPQNELKIQDYGLDDQIPHYYTRELVFPIQRPSPYPQLVTTGPDAPDVLSARTPNLAVYWSDDQGRSWHKAGYFGLDQSFFAFVAPGPGDYSIRFAGPGVPPSPLADQVPPHRVYHVDATPPRVIVQVAAANGMVKQFYEPGEKIVVSWDATDQYIDQDKAPVLIYRIIPPATIEPIFGNFTLKGEFEENVPGAAMNGGIRYGVQAVDKAGNIGRGFSFLVQAASVIQPEPAREQMYTPATPPASQPAVGPTVAPREIYPVTPRTTPSGTAPEPMPGGPPIMPSTPPAGHGADRTPLIPTPTMPLTPAVPPTRPDGPGASSPVAPPAVPAAIPTPLHSADKVIQPDLRPTLYPPTSQVE